MKLIIFFVLLIFIALSGCTSKSNTSRKPIANILITPSNRVITIGNEFTIKIETKLNGTKLENIELYIDNKLIKKTEKSTLSLSINSTEYLPGNHSIKTIVKNTDGNIGVNFNSISILSDIVPLNLSYEIIKIIPHNYKNFTQGLEFYSGKLFESTGDYGTSFIYEYNNELNKVVNSLKIENQYFGEGITILKDKIYQLTYKSKIGFVYDVDTFKKIGEFSFSSQEGWGLTNDGTYLIMSDGTSIINYINPSDFSIVKSIQVTSNDGFIINLNELEFVDGYIYANIWTTEMIVKIEAKTGKVIAFIDMKGLKSSLKSTSIDVLNGIAYNKQENLFYVTGKLWPSIFKLRFRSK